MRERSEAAELGAGGPAAGDRALVHHEARVLLTLALGGPVRTELAGPGEVRLRVRVTARHRL